LILPLLLNKGLMSEAEEVRDFSLKQIVSIAKTSGKKKKKKHEKQIKRT